MACGKRLYPQLYGGCDGSLPGRFSYAAGGCGIKAAREQEGFTFMLAQDSDLVELIDFATDVFNPDWGRAIREGLRAINNGSDPDRARSRKAGGILPA